MSHSALPTNKIQVSDRSMQRGLPVTMTEETSLYHEIYETIRTLLQHIVYVLLLTSRLYMLPLLHISQKLAKRDEPWYPASWNSISFPRRTLVDYDQGRQSGGGGAVAETWHNLRADMLAPVTVFKNLYSWGKMLNADPNAPPQTSIPLSRVTPDDAMTAEIKDKGILGDQGSDSADSTDSQLEAPVSSSQLYHAALLNGSTLHEILAAFEADEGDRGIIFDRIVIRRSPKASLSAENLDAMDQYKRQRYRSSSILSTAERVIASGKTHEHAPGFPVQPSSQTDHQRGEAPDGKANVTQIRVQGKCEDDLQRPLSSADSHTSFGHCPSDVQSHDRSVGSNVLNHCPTFIRRHSQSLLPRRSLGKDKQAFAMLKERGAMSTPVLPSSTPTRRARLQRRVTPKPAGRRLEWMGNNGAKLAG